MRAYDGTNWIDASAAVESVFAVYNYTATSGQTTFSGSDDNANTLSYTAPNLFVTLNGIMLESGTDYTATSGTSIVLASGAALNDEVNIYAIRSFSVADTVSAANGGTFSGNITFDGNATFNGTVTGIDALPSQTGNSGKYLTTDGSAASWAVLDTDANTTTKGLYEMANTISANYSITSGNNALSAGPITVASGVTVTVPTGSRWVVI